MACPPEEVKVFSQQHYEALAKLLQQERLQITDDQTKGITSPQYAENARNAIGSFQIRLQAFLKKDNPKFKELLFIGAASEHAPKANG